MHLTRSVGSAQGMFDRRLVRGGAHLSDARADAVVVLDLAEHQRRRSLGLGAVTELALLDTLTTLPRGFPVSIGGLAARDRESVQSAPPGIFSDGSEGASPLLVPAVEVVAVEVRSGTWHSRIRRAASFARFAPTSIILRGEPSDEQLLQADFYGIGVVGGGTAGRQYLEPAAVAPSFSAVRWLFRERAYASMLAFNGPAG